ncbi:MAG: hypothetical protein EOL98_09090 [Negativicutes bacterium]|nr:hypothetical protein [Negativicutes bacterium]
MILNINPSCATSLLRSTKANAKQGRQHEVPDTLWADKQWIKEQMQRKWDSGQILRELLEPSGLFPLKMPLKRPQNKDINESFAEIAQWIKNLKNNSKDKIGFGYELLEKEIAHRQSGRNSLPTHAVIPSVWDAVRYLKKEREAKQYLEIAAYIARKWSLLQPWIAKYPHKVLTNGNDWQGILSVLEWFKHHEKSGLYLRQLEIPGIDSKFIEQRKALFTELLNIVLRQEAITTDTSCFEERFGLRVKPVQVRLRILDPEYYMQGVSDLTIPVEELALLDLGIKQVFITENEINGLSFPLHKDSIVIFGLGYGVDILKKVAWLKNKNISYWGDLDTHGFAMLNEVRSFLPQTCSMLMTEEILMAHQKLWSVENKAFKGELARLTYAEQQVFHALQDDILGKGVRLEQERIDFEKVRAALAV